MEGDSNQENVPCNREINENSAVEIISHQVEINIPTENVPVSSHLQDLNDEKNYLDTSTSCVESVDVNDKEVPNKQEPGQISPIKENEDYDAIRHLSSKTNQYDPQYIKEYCSINKDDKPILERKKGLHDSSESTPDATMETLENKLQAYGKTGIMRNLIESGESAMGDLFYLRKPNNRPEWSSRWEFLMSCIAMSVGLGNVWRFPFAAYENGGGAFLVPYIIVIFLVGQPMYYLEIVLGQFSGRNSIRVWVLSPVLTGVGYGQLVATFSIVTYYVVLMALTLFYTYKSFESKLPWATCNPEWGPNCYSASEKLDHSIYSNQNKTSSSELFFIKEVLRKSDVSDGTIGYPDWRLSLCLIISWLGVFLVMMKGVKSSGKAAYVMAILPYIILITLLIKTFTLDGAMDGIYFFITPDWKQLYNPQVWYSAVTQVFFSLTVCIGAIIMYSSFNNFRQPIYRDVLTVVLLDTVTSLVSGFAIFGILGNLAHEKNIKNISDVIGTGGQSLAFVSFPDAIAKFDHVPQVFSVLFFFMLWVLGLGSAVSYQSSIVIVFSDRFKKTPLWVISLIACTVTCIIGHIYITPSGQNILNIVDYFGGTFLVLCLSIIELIGISWTYGLENICEDIEFMSGKQVSAYWRWCWGVVTPLIMLFVLGYEMTRHGLIKTLHDSAPPIIYVAVYVLVIFGLLQLPIWALIIHIRRQSSLLISARSIYQATNAWGPKDGSDYQSWMLFKDTRRRYRDSKKFSTRKHLWYSLNGYYKTPQFGNNFSY